MRMPHIVIRDMPGSTAFFHIISQKTQFFWKSYWTQNVCFDFLYNFCLKKFLILRRIQWDIITNVHGYSWTVPVIRVRF